MMNPIALVAPVHAAQPFPSLPGAEEEEGTDDFHALMADGPGDLQDGHVQDGDGRAGDLLLEVAAAAPDPSAVITAIGIAPLAPLAQPPAVAAATEYAPALPLRFATGLALPSAETIIVAPSFIVSRSFMPAEPRPALPAPSLAALAAQQPESDAPLQFAGPLPGTIDLPPSREAASKLQLALPAPGAERQANPVSSATGFLPSAPFLPGVAESALAPSSSGLDTAADALVPPPEPGLVYARATLTPEDRPAPTKAERVWSMRGLIFPTAVPAAEEPAFSILSAQTTAFLAAPSLGSDVPAHPSVLASALSKDPAAISSDAQPDTDQIDLDHPIPDPFALGIALDQAVEGVVLTALFDRSALVPSQIIATPQMPPGQPPAVPLPLPQALLGEAMAPTGDGIFLALSPQELGPLHMKITPDGTTLLVAIAADRPETLDLLRRHADLLALDLRQAGFATTSFSFSQSGSHGFAQAQPQLQPQRAAVGFDPAGPPQAQDRPSPPKHSRSGLDLRL